MVLQAFTRLDLVVNVRFPGPRANGIQVAAMAESLAATGLNVDVVVPRRFPHSDLDPFAYYGVKRTFAVQRLANIDTIDMVSPSLQRVPFLVQSVTFGLRALARAAVEDEAGVLVRDHYSMAVLAGGLRPAHVARLAAEVHNLPEPGPRRRRVAATLARLSAVVTISDALRDDLLGEGLAPENVLVARDGVHLERFGALPDALTARPHLGLDAQRPTVVYAGQLYPWKGVDTLVEAVGRVSECQLLVLGGDRQNLPRVMDLAERRAPGRVVFAGQVPHHQVPFYLAAADVIALPNSGREEISARYTSPLKLFEAMASERAILATDLPSLREVLVPGHNAMLVPPDDAEALAEGLATLMADEALRKRLARAAREDVEPFDWGERGRRVASFLRDRFVSGGLP